MQRNKNHQSTPEEIQAEETLSTRQENLLYSSIEDAVILMRENKINETDYKNQKQNNYI